MVLVLHYLLADCSMFTVLNWFVADSDPLKHPSPHNSKY